MTTPDTAATTFWCRSVVIQGSAPGRSLRVLDTRRVAGWNTGWITFDPAFVANAFAQLNTRHGDDALAICRHLGGTRDAVTAMAVSLDGEAIHFLADAGTGSVEVRVPFLQPVTVSGEVRVAVVRLARHAREIGGVA